MPIVHIVVLSTCPHMALVLLRYPKKLNVLLVCTELLALGGKPFNQVQAWR